MAKIDGLIIFCDDVRNETSNKISYSGVFGSAVFIDDSPAILSTFAAVFLGQIHGVKSVNLKMKMELLNYSEKHEPFEVVREFSDESGLGFPEWSLRVNLKGPIPVEDGAIVKVTCEAEGFKTESTLRLILSEKGQEERDKRANEGKAEPSS